jgi:hypothetical protein
MVLRSGRGCTFSTACGALFQRNGGPRVEGRGRRRSHRVGPIGEIRLIGPDPPWRPGLRGCERIQPGRQTRNQKPEGFVLVSGFWFAFLAGCGGDRTTEAQRCTEVHRERQRMENRVKTSILLRLLCVSLCLCGVFTLASHKILPVLPVALSRHPIVLEETVAPLDAFRK